MSDHSAQAKQTTQPLGAYVPTATVERLREQARLEDRSMSSLVRRALDDYLRREQAQR